MPRAAPSKPKRSRSLRSHRCAVCSHADVVRIEMLRLGGATLDTLAAKFDLHRDAIWRHMRDHVDADRRVQLIADVPMSELAERAHAEGTSLLDNLSIVRSIVMQQMLTAAAVNDRRATAALAGRATEVLGEIGRLTGEILKATPGTINNNTLVLMSAPQFIELEQNLLRWLAPFPEAMRAVIEGLGTMQNVPAAPASQSPALPPTIEAEVISDGAA